MLNTKPIKKISNEIINNKNKISNSSDLLEKKDLYDKDKEYRKLWLAGL